MPTARSVGHCFSDDFSEPANLQATLRLQRLVESGNAKAIPSCLAQGADPDAPNRVGRTALMSAAACGGARMVELLLPASNAASLDTVQNHALHWAAAAGSAECVALLMDACDPLAHNIDGDTPLHLAAASGALDCLLLLLPRSDAFALGKPMFGALSALGRAVGRGHLECVAALLPASDPNQKMGLGRTPLMFACATFLCGGLFSADDVPEPFSRVYSAMMSALVAASDLSARDDHGLTAFELALQFEHWLCADAFFEAASDAEVLRAVAECKNPEKIPQLFARSEAMAISGAMESAPLSVGPLAQAGARVAVSAPGTAQSSARPARAL